jgi:XTP/dITP diphosphohydrolase
MRLVFATNNLNKLSELQDLLPSNIELIGLKDIGCNQELPETQKTLQGNAMQKAEFVFEHFGYNCFADDTGLEVGILKNEPGVYSARYAGQNCNPNDNIQKVLKKLIGRNDRTARFRTVIALIVDGKKSLFEGECEGEITKERKGENGFGYDPIFLPKGVNMTFAQMTKKQKGEISHRGRAIKKLVNFLQKN